MKTWRWMWSTSLLIALLTGAALAGTNGLDLAKWSHVAAVEVPIKPVAGVVEVAIPPEVMAVSRPDLADLRLTGPTGDVVPYVLRVDQGEPGRSVSYHPTRMFNAVFVPHKENSVTVDFGTRAARSRVDIDTPGTNFRRRVMVEASEDGATWQVLRKTAWLFRIAYDAGSYNKSDITLPDNDFRYLRITVSNAPDDPEQITIRDVIAWYVKSTPPKTPDVPVRALTVTEKPKQQATEIEVDLGYENLPLHDVALAFDDANFLRRVAVFGRNVRTRTIIEPVENAQPRKREMEEPWANVAGGTVYRMPAGEGQDPSTGLSVALDGQYRYLLIRIYNADDAPLKFSGLKVSRLQYFLAFHPEAAGSYRLFMANLAAQKPQYDLENYVGRLRSEGVTETTLGPVTPNPLFTVATKVVPWSERYAWLLWVTLLAVAAVLGALVLRQARHARPVN